MAPSRSSWFPEKGAGPQSLLVCQTAAACLAGRLCFRESRPQGKQCHLLCRLPSAAVGGWRAGRRDVPFHAYSRSLPRRVRLNTERLPADASSSLITRCVLAASPNILFVWFLGGKQTGKPGSPAFSRRRPASPQPPPWRQHFPPQETLKMLRKPSQVSGAGSRGSVLPSSGPPPEQQAARRSPV